MNTNNTLNRTLNLYNTRITYSVTRRRNQKHIRIKIEHDGKLNISGPLSITESHIKEILHTKAAWIHKNIQKQLSKSLPDILETLMFKGDIYNVKILNSSKNSIKIDGNTISISSRNKNRDCIKEQLSKWLKKETLKEMESLLSLLTEKTGIKYKKTSIRNQKSRWGSSSGSGTLSFNFRIIMAPLHVREYLAVHELCHQKHHNHSARFWKEVEKWQPDYKQAEKWLKNHSAIMNLFR